MKKILALDQTETFLNASVGECYHPLGEVFAEIEQKYLRPCKIREFAKSGELKILDVGSGLGYNSALALEIALQENPQGHVEIICLENDSRIIEKIQEVNPKLKYYPYFKKLNKNNLVIEENFFSLKLILGNAEEKMKQLANESFDTIFVDFFSPQATPESWSKEFFSEVYRVLKPTGIVSTFTADQKVRENMAQAGLFYGENHTQSRRGPGTIATKW